MVGAAQIGSPLAGQANSIGLDVVVDDLRRSKPSPTTVAKEKDNEQLQQECRRHRETDAGAVWRNTNLH
jgi:hypothetical protein